MLIVLTEYRSGWIHNPFEDLCDDHLGFWACSSSSSSCILTRNTTDPKIWTHTLLKILNPHTTSYHCGLNQL